VSNLLHEIDRIHIDLYLQAVVSGSFHGFDQSYLLDALALLGPGFVGVTQLPATVTDDEIREKYLERAIRELNRLTHELQECEHCQRGSLMPVLGSGHPQADIMLLKYAPSTSEVEEGVAFYGKGLFLCA